MSESKKISTMEVARRYGVHPNQVTRDILLQKLFARKDGSGRYLIDEKSAEAWHTNRRRRPSDASVAVVHAVRALAGQGRKGSKNRGKGSAAERVRQPASGESVKALRQTGLANRPSNDSWQVNTEEPAKS